MATVLHSVSRWLPQTENWLYNQIAHLPPEIENYIVCEIAENLDQFWLPNIRALSEAAPWRFYWDKSLRRLHLRNHLGFKVEQARQHGAGVLHSHFGNVGWADMGVARRASLKHVVTFYGHDVNRLPRLNPRWYERYRKLFENVDRVLCEGSHMAESIVELGCPEHKVRVHHLGVRVGEIDFRPRARSQGEPLRVLIAASFREKKGIPDAIEALARVQYQVPVEVTIIGDATHEPRSQEEKKKILAAIEKYDLGPRVRMLGYQPHHVFHKEAYRHHVFLSPSITARDGDTEGGAPVSIIEAAASGMPIVSTRHCDIPEIVKDGVTGLLTDEGDVEELAAHLCWLANHPQKWCGLLDAGREHTVAYYDSARQAQNLASIYEEILL